MRFPVAIAACLALALVAAAGQASAQSQSDSSEAAARLLVLNDAAAPGVRILRGSAAPPRAIAPPPYPAPEQYAVLGPSWQAVGGERFWMLNRDTGQLASCRNRGTANVGEREVECTFGTFSRYRRTFGNNFRH